MSSIFASDVTQELGIMHAGAAQTITLRKLTGRELVRAEFESLKSTAAGMSSRGWAPKLRRVLAAGATDADAEEALVDPLVGFDRYTIVAAGVAKWTLARPLTPAALEDLDDETVDILATEILRLTKPRLFLDAAALEAHQKKD